MSLSGIPVFAAADRPGSKQVLRRTRRFSWMTSGWFGSTDLGAGDGGTACMTLGCSDDFVAVRLGFPNISEQPWRMTRIIGRPSTGFNDYVTPTGEAPWTPFTMVHGGADTADIVASDAGPTEVEVAGLDNTPLCRAAGVRWTWTDWASMRSVVPDSDTGMRVLMLRALIPSSQTVTFAIGQLRQLTGNRALTHNHDVMIGGLKFDIDMVSRPDIKHPGPTQIWVDNQLVTGTMFPLVQFLTCKPGISGLVTGDSHAQGTSTTEQFLSFMFAATTMLGQSYLDRIPFSMVNCAVGGLGSEEFFARLALLMQSLQPSYVVLPGWTYNDATRGTNADQAAMNIFLARLLSAAESCSIGGSMPIILTPFPRNADAMTPVQLAPWHGLRDTLVELGNSSATAVIDAATILGRQMDGILDGTYLPSMSVDQMHPSDDGHGAVARALAEKLIACL